MTMFTREDASAVERFRIQHYPPTEATQTMADALNVIIAPKVEAMIAAARAETPQGLPPGFRAQAALAVFARLYFDGDADDTMPVCAERAVCAADALIAALAKEPQE